MKRLTTKDFIDRARLVHGRRYSYKSTEYHSMKDKVEVICKVHGPFVQKAEDHLSGCGCPRCGLSSISARKFKGKDNFMADAILRHGNKYDYARVVYRSARDPVKIRCTVHNLVFLQRPDKHLRGAGCPTCALETKSAKLITPKTSFVRKAKEIHGDAYTYRCSVYTGANNLLEVRCRKHGVFTVTPNSHLNSKIGCPSCREPNNGYSRVAIEWIEREAHSRRMKNVQHAENGGEYYIPGTHLRVDGYHARSKTIFEFYGDAFHGNPEIYKAHSRPHPYLNRTAAKLYRDTMKREALLVSLGYNVISIWERDYRLQAK